MAQAAAASLPPEQKARLHEVADLMLEIYQTLVEMRYLEPEGIIRGPHHIDQELLAECNKHGLDPAVIYLYSILPYIDEAEAQNRDFFHGSAFADFRKAGEVRQGRDPFYARPEGDFEDERGQYMRPWYTPLDHLSNHSSVMIYDARGHQIWVIDQCGWGSTDPGIVKGYHPEEPKEASNWGDSDGSSYEDDDDDDVSSHGSSEFWEDDEQLGPGEVSALQAPEEDEQVDYNEGFELVEAADDETEPPRSQNQNSFEHIRSRPAAAFLRDVRRWYAELKELPGRGEHTHQEIWSLPDDVLRDLYRRSGWLSGPGPGPGSGLMDSSSGSGGGGGGGFDGDRFEVDGLRAYCAERARYFAEEPLREVECYKSWLGIRDQKIARCEERIAQAATPDDEWLARYEIWRHERSHARTVRNLARARAAAARLCPGGICQRDADLPLWEAEQARVELRDARRSARRNNDWAATAAAASAAATADDDAAAAAAATRRRTHEARARQSRHQVEIAARARAEARADAERLCPGRSFRDVFEEADISSGNNNNTNDGDGGDEDKDEVEIEELRRLGGATPAQNLRRTAAAAEAARREAAALRAWGAESLPPVAAGVDELPRTREAVERDAAASEAHERSGRAQVERLRAWIEEHGDGEGDEEDEEE
ncbi:hypothetical protein GGR56DRAFT_696067 [Xylariaceae sp. FL0804]|nr:hypothetical protein GGR56DRAFT_696067 [Xylariaceae sp. FL0804]